MRSRFRILAVLVLLTGCCMAADKPETWTEVRSPHFVVVTLAGEKQGRQLAEQFEQIRAVFQTALPQAKVDPGQPVIILAVKDEKGLKVLLPEYWETKGRMHPAGIFQRSHEKNYVALRLDVQGDNPYHVIYHEYFHLIESLNLRVIPVWLNEGLADFYGNTSIQGKEVRIGLPSEYQAEAVRNNRIIPLSQLLTADRNSPLYNEANKSSMFYAESWALTHYLMLADHGAHRQKMNDFLDLLHRDVPEQDALQQVFGDLRRLEKIMEAYVGQESFFALRMKAPADIDEKKFAARVLTPAEAAAVKGDFYFNTKRPEEAKAQLEEALRLNPNLAAAHESMGFLMFSQGQRAEAGKWFEQAVQLDSNSHLAHYYNAVLSLQVSRDTDALARAETSLRRAVELNPRFAPALDALSNVYAMRNQNMEQALSLALQATQLEPGNFVYHLHVANLLMRMGKTSEAQQLGQRLLVSARSEPEQRRALSFLDNVRRFEESRLAVEEARKAAAERQKQLETAQKTTVAKEEGEPRAPETRSQGKTKGPGKAAGPRAAAQGRISQVTCTSPAVLDLTIDLSGYSLKLRSNNYFQLEFLSTTWEPPADFQPCQHLKGLRAKVLYNAVGGQDYGGEIISIEIRD